MITNSQTLTLKNGQSTGAKKITVAVKHSRLNRNPCPAVAPEVREEIQKSTAAVPVPEKKRRTRVRKRKFPKGQPNSGKYSARATSDEFQYAYKAEQKRQFRHILDISGH